MPIEENMDTWKTDCDPWKVSQWQVWDQLPDFRVFLPPRQAAPSRTCSSMAPPSREPEAILGPPLMVQADAFISPLWSALTDTPDLLGLGL